MTAAEYRQACAEHPTVPAQARALGLSLSQWRSLRPGLIAGGVIPPANRGRPSGGKVLTLGEVVVSSVALGRGLGQLRVPWCVMRALGVAAGDVAEWTGNGPGSVTVRKAGGGR